MYGPLNVAVADDEPRMREYYREILPRLGHRVTVAAATGRELVDACRDERPDLIITNVRMPDLDGIDAVRAIGREEPIAVILVSAHHDPATLERAREEHILAYLVKPITRPDLDAAIAIACSRFDQFQALRKEAGELRQALEDRKVIARAKGVLMRQANLDEGEAFRRLQKLARDHNQKLVVAAQTILRADEAFRPTAR